MIFEQMLGWASLAAALAAIGVYVWLVAKRAKVLRLMTSLSLFLTGLALFQGPSILAQTNGDLSVRLAIASLIAATAVQIVAAVRTRPAWTGEDRRAA